MSRGAMREASSLDAIRDKLRPSFIKTEVKLPKLPSKGYGFMAGATSLSAVPEKILLTDRVKLVGILFGRPAQPEVKGDILPDLLYFHERSGENVDFFFAGYSSDRGEDDAQEAATIGDKKWFFSARAFNRMRAEVEASVKWRYSGGSDLLLTNAHLNAETKTVELGFSTSIICPLREMLRIKAIPSISEFFEQIFRYADKQNPNDPTYGLSDSLGWDKAGSILKGVILSLLPKGIGPEAEKLVYLAARDISK